MRICFVDNILIDHNSATGSLDLQPHLGLLSLIAVAERGGHQVHLFDPKLELARGALSLGPELYREMGESLLRQSPDVVGFTSLGCNFICTVKVAAYLKHRNPALRIILGGPHATILSRAIVGRYQQFDVVVRNEAELVLLRLLDGLERGRIEAVPGITFRTGNRVKSNADVPLIDDLDRLEWPAYHHYPIRELGLTSIRVEAGRGCPFSCTFCSTASFFGRRYRLKGASRLLAELDYLNVECGIRDFALTHDLFTVNRGKVREFCEAVEGRSYTWSCSARMDCVDDELLTVMARAGCRAIYYGVETGSPRMQRVVEKRQDLSLFAPRLDKSEALGLRVVASFITGYPQEEQEDQDQTLDLIGSCFQRAEGGLKVQLHLLTPEPGTQLFNEFGKSLQYDGYVADFNFPTLEVDDAAVMSKAPEIFMNHHYYPSAISRERHLFTISAFQALYPLGFAVLAYAVRRYEGRLSRLVGQMYEWAQAEGVAAGDLEGSLEAFFEREYGRGHWITSVVRYMTAAVGARRVLRRAASELSDIGGGGVFGRGASYVLRPGATILRDLHNCPSILASLARRDGDPDDMMKGISAGLANYVIVVEDVASGHIRNFVVGEQMAKLLVFLKRSRTYRECGAYWQRLGEDLKTLRGLLKELCAAGILQAGDVQGSGFTSRRTRRQSVRLADL